MASLPDLKSLYASLDEAKAELWLAFEIYVIFQHDTQSTSLLREKFKVAMECTAAIDRFNKAITSEAAAETLE
jgi:hypothetical protein